MTIENFRPYKGPVHIDFSEGEKNITIIQGRNDMGKTSFINAFTWCLYDKEPFRDEGVEGRCNQLALDNVNIKDEVRQNAKTNTQGDVNNTEEKKEKQNPQKAINETEEISEDKNEEENKEELIHEEQEDKEVITQNEE